MKDTPIERKIAEIVTPALTELGLDLVCVRMIGEERGQILQIMAENPETNALGIEDCARVSRAVSTLLDVEDPIRGAYRLEVSSPGIDRPLTRVQDFVRFAGEEARVEMDVPVGGQKRFRGILKGLDGDAVQLETENGPASLPLADIARAKLIMTEELLRKSLAAKTVLDEDDAASEDGSEDDED